RVARQPVPPPPVHGDVARGAEPAAGAHRRGGGGTGDREPAVERDEVFPRASPYSRGGGRRGGLRARARDRPWNRDSAAAAAQELPQVLPRADRRGDRRTRYGPRPRHRRSLRAGAWRLREG